MKTMGDKLHSTNLISSIAHNQDSHWITKLGGVFINIQGENFPTFASSGIEESGNSNVHFCKDT